MKATPQMPSVVSFNCGVTRRHEVRPQALIYAAQAPCSKLITRTLTSTAAASRLNLVLPENDARLAHCQAIEVQAGRGCTEAA